MVPTQNRQLLMLVFYGYDSKLCSIEAMKQLVSHYCTSKGPCIVRKFIDNDQSQKKSIYLPNWKVKNFPANRIAQHVVASVNLHSLFVSGGFGDLAVAESVPSATGDPKKVSHLQHYGLLSFRNSPSEKAGSESQALLDKSSKKSKRTGKNKNNPEKSSFLPINEPNANEIEMVPYPICVVLWDKNRELPAYMGKITGELTKEEIEEREQLDTTRKQGRKWWFC